MQFEQKIKKDFSSNSITSIYLKQSFFSKNLKISWANSEEDVREAQRLRYEVFAFEMGANLKHKGNQARLDIDQFDIFCDHLLVHSVNSSGKVGRLLGTYRLLPPAAAIHAGKLYSDSEFDLKPLEVFRPKMVEIGRSCVHPAGRTGNVILALWSGLGQYMMNNQLDTMMGCASMRLIDEGQLASKLWYYLRKRYLIEKEFQIKPKCALPLLNNNDQLEDSNQSYFPAYTPALIKGYLRCGSRLLGPPAIDYDFNTADFPIMLQLKDITSRYRNHFFGGK